MCALDFDGTPGFWDINHPVARKPHACVVCSRTIAVGERYMRESGKWEGSVFSDACTPFANSFIVYLQGCIDDRDEESNRTWGPMLERIEARRAAA